MQAVRLIKLVIRRDPATNSYSLKCACGLRIEMPRDGDAMMTIMWVAIDEEPRILNNGTYLVVGNEPDEIHIGPATLNKR